MTNLPRPTVAAIIGAAVLSALSVGAAVAPARAEAETAPSSMVGGSSNIAGAHYVPVRM